MCVCVCVEVRWKEKFSSFERAGGRRERSLPFWNLAGYYRSGGLDLVFVIPSSFNFYSTCRPRSISSPIRGAEVL